MPAQSLSILIIDPDGASRNYLAALLGKSGFTLLTTGLGKEGLIMAWRDKPDVIVLDPALPDLPGLELVTRLRQDRRTARMPLVALSNKEDSQQMAALLAAGCSEYLVKSTPSLQRLMDYLTRLAGGGKTAVLKKEGRLIAFLSAKGGTGTSSLCANVAMCMASEHPEQKVAVVDLVLPIGSIAQIVGYDEPLSLITLADMPASDTPPEYFTKNLPTVSGWLFHLLAGSPDPDAANRVAPDRVVEILQAMVGAYDIVFVDLGRSLSRISLPILQQAQVIGLIVSTDRATADLTQTVCNYLKAQGVDSQRIYAIQNRAVGLEGLTKAELEKMINIPVRVTMPYIGDNMTVANNRHEPLAARFQSDAAALLLKQVANEMIELNQKRAR